MTGPNGGAARGSATISLPMGLDVYKNLRLETTLKTLKPEKGVEGGSTLDLEPGDFCGSQGASGPGSFRDCHRSWVPGLPLSHFAMGLEQVPLVPGALGLPERPSRSNRL